MANEPKTTSQPDDLGKFEGKRVAGVRLSIRKTGDGLSDNMKVEPVVLKHGERVYVLLECAVGAIDFVPMKDAPQLLWRDTVLNTEYGVVVDRDLAAAMLQEQRDRIDAALTEQREAAERERAELEAQEKRKVEPPLLDEDGPSPEATGNDGGDGNVVSIGKAAGGRKAPARKKAAPRKAAPRKGK